MPSKAEQVSLGGRRVKLMALILEISPDLARATSIKTSGRSVEMYPPGGFVQVDLENEGYGVSLSLGGLSEDELKQVLGTLDKLSDQPYRMKSAYA